MMFWLKLLIIMIENMFVFYDDECDCFVRFWIILFNGCCVLLVCS